MDLEQINLAVLMFVVTALVLLCVFVTVLLMVLHRRRSLSVATSPLLVLGAKPDPALPPPGSYEAVRTGRSSAKRLHQRETSTRTAMTSWRSACPSRTSAAPATTPAW